MDPLMPEAADPPGSSGDLATGCLPIRAGTPVLGSCLRLRAGTPPLKGLHLGRVEVVVAAVPLVELARRVVLERHGHVDLTVDVLEDPGDPAVAPLEKDVVRVGSPLGADPHARTLADLDAAD